MPPLYGNGSKDTTALLNSGNRFQVSPAADPPLDQSNASTTVIDNILDQSDGSATVTHSMLNRLLDNTQPGDTVNGAAHSKVNFSEKFGFKLPSDLHVIKVPNNSPKIVRKLSRRLSQKDLDTISNKAPRSLCSKCCLVLALGLIIAAVVVLITSTAHRLGHINHVHVAPPTLNLNVTTENVTSQNATWKSGLHPKFVSGINTKTATLINSTDLSLHANDTTTTWCGYGCCMCFW